MQALIKETDINADNIPNLLVKIKGAFDVFESQSGLLHTAYQALKKDLAEANRQLNSKNTELSDKVRELQETSGRLQSILESMTDGVLVVDDNLVVNRCNPAAEKILRLSHKQIEGRRYDAITNGLGNADMLMAAVNKGKPTLDERRATTTKDGEEITVMASVSPIRSPLGRVLGAVEVLRDVTELQVLEKKVASQQRMAALGEMAASVAHEIRNPLGTIEGFARLLNRDLANKPEYSRLTSKIVEGTQNLNYVISNLLTYARPLSPQYGDFDTERLFATVRETLEPRAAHKKVRLNFKQTRPIGMNADIRQLRQVLLNLGLNAIDACAENGSVLISAEQNSTTTILTVADDGCGISEADRNKIFDPFFTRKQDGTGLGLSLCHKIVSSHGGEIQVLSEENRGATFKVILPRSSSL